MNTTTERTYTCWGAPYRSRGRQPRGTSELRIDPASEAHVVAQRL